LEPRIPGHVITTETEARASKRGFHVEQQTLRLIDVNSVRFEYKVANRQFLPTLHGSQEKCREMITALQKRHATSGFNAETNTHWAHDMPEGGSPPDTIFRWVLV
jgi:hypothetical protein